MGVDRHQAGRTIFGLFAILVGVLYLLDNLDIIDAHAVLHFWPALFIVVGLVKITQARSPQAGIVGAAFLLAGVLMILGRLGLPYMNWHTLWPLIVIMAGLAVIFKPSRWERRNGVAGSAVTNDDAVVNITAVLGGVKNNIQSQQFRGGEITAVMGGCNLDLRTASIEGGDAVLDVFAMWGGIEIKVPTDWTVILQGTPILGGFEDKTLPPAEKNKRLVVKGYTIMGGLEVRN